MRTASAHRSNAVTTAPKETIMAASSSISQGIPRTSTSRAVSGSVPFDHGLPNGCGPELPPGLSQVVSGALQAGRAARLGIAW